MHLLPPAPARGRSGHELAYLKAGCSEQDVYAGFFLHVVPKDPRSLPAIRRQHGFDNLDFLFENHGTFVDGWCMARIRLPDYDWLGIDTGRAHTDDQGENWQVRIEAEGPSRQRHPEPFENAGL